MDNDKKEPQSYGSGDDWVSGDTGQTVNRLKGAPNSQNSDFYASRHDEEAPQGGSPGEGDEERAARPHRSFAHAQDDGAHEPVQKVTVKDGGAKRQSYWKERDYKE